MSSMTTKTDGTVNEIIVYVGRHDRGIPSGPIDSNGKKKTQ